MSAVISPCGQYRYTLTRSRRQAMLPSSGTTVFCMLNPSTADSSIDDPTIRRCRGFADRWNSAGLLVVNLYALRSTDPAGLWKHADPVGPDNDRWLRGVARKHGTIVCAWGGNARTERVQQVVEIFRAEGAALKCFDTVRNGNPRHPLYVRADQPLVDWTPSPSMEGSARP